MALKLPSWTWNYDGLTGEGELANVCVLTSLWWRENLWSLKSSLLFSVELMDLISTVNSPIIYSFEMDRVLHPAGCLCMDSEAEQASVAWISQICKGPGRTYSMAVTLAVSAAEQKTQQGLVGNPAPERGRECTREENSGLGLQSAVKYLGYKRQRDFGVLTLQLSLLGS